MNHKEHKEYLREFKEYSKKITLTKDSSIDFLMKLGVSQKNGNLTRSYTCNAEDKMEYRCTLKEQV